MRGKGRNDLRTRIGARLLPHARHVPPLQHPPGCHGSSGPRAKTVSFVGGRSLALTDPWAPLWFWLWPARPGVIVLPRGV